MDTNNTLFYTFTSFPETNLKGYSYIVLRSLKYDLQELFKCIELEKPEYVIGLAKYRRSQIEAQAINQYNKTKKVSKNNPIQLYDLYIPQSLDFKINTNPYDSFCNWAAFKVTEFLDDHEIKHSFIHVNLGDWGKVPTLAHKR